jgi:hypothetical protein
MMLPRRHEQGMSLIEVSLACAVLIVMSVAIVQSMRSLSSTQTYMAESTKTSSLAERVASAIEQDVAHTVQMFAEDARGRGFLARMELGRTLLAGSRLPVSTTRGTFEVDPADEVQTGNLLFLARMMAPTLADAGESGAPELLRIDTLRFVVWFLESGEVTGVDVGRWSSAPVARLQDLAALSDPDRRARLCRSLWSAGIRHAWDPRVDPAAGALWAIDADGELAAMGTARIPADPQQCELRILGRRHLGIARNGTTAIDVPSFARAQPGFPHGFEIKCDGDATGGLLLVRLVASNRVDGQRQVAAAAATRQVAFRVE